MEDMMTTDSYAVVKAADNISEIMRENLGAEAVGPLDLPRIKVPAGGGQAWDVPSLHGTEPAKDITGVIIHSQISRVWWRGTIEEAGGNQPPDCTSDDGVTGRGMMADRDEVGGACDKCPMSKFGSAVNGRGQACKQIRTLFIIREQDVIPMTLVVPPTSLGNCKAYLFQLVSAQKRYTQVITRCRLEAATNSSGIRFSRIIFECAGVLDAKQAKIFAGIRTTMAPAFGSVHAADKR